MQPGRERRLATKGCDLAIELQERFLSQVFGLGGVCRHAQAERIHTPLVTVVKRLEGFRVALLGFLDRFGFAEFLNLPSLGSVKFPFPAALIQMRHNYLYVVWLASVGSGTKVISKFKILEHFYRSWHTS